MSFQATDFKIFDVRYAGSATWRGETHCHGQRDCPRCNQNIHIVRGQIVGMVDTDGVVERGRELPETVPLPCGYKTRLQWAVGRYTERPTG